MFHLCYLYLFMHTCIQHDFHIRWCSYRLKVTRRVSHMEQELLTIPEHLSSPPVFRSVRVARSLVFSIVFCRSLFVFLYFFFWPLYCLSLNLRILITSLVSSYFSSTLNNWQQKQIQHMALEIRLLAWDSHNNVTGLNWLKGYIIS